MPRVEVTLPDRLEAQLNSLVDQQDEFVSRDEAMEELLEMGLRAYQPTGGGRADEGGLDEVAEAMGLANDDEEFEDRQQS